MLCFSKWNTVSRLLSFCHQATFVSDPLNLHKTTDPHPQTTLGPQYLLSRLCVVSLAQIKPFVCNEISYQVSSSQCLLQIPANQPYLPIPPSLLSLTVLPLNPLCFMHMILLSIKYPVRLTKDVTDLCCVVVVDHANLLSFCYSAVPPLH